MAPNFRNDRWDDVIAYAPAALLLSFVVGLWLTPWVQLAYAVLIVIAMAVIIWQTHKDNTLKFEVTIGGSSTLVACVIFYHALYRMGQVAHPCDLLELIGFSPRNF